MSNQEGTLSSPTLHGYVLFTLIQDENSSKWISESDQTLDGLVQKLKGRGDAQKLPNIINIDTLSTLTYPSKNETCFKEQNNTIPVSPPPEVVNPGTNYAHDAVTFVKNYVKSCAAVSKYPRKRLVFSTQKPLNYAMTGSQYLGTKSGHGYKIKAVVKDEAGLPQYIQLSVEESKQDKSASNGLRSGNPFEAAVCGNTLEEQKRVLLYSVHSFMDKNFWFFYSSEIDAIDQTNTPFHYTPTEVKTWHPTFAHKKNLYRYKLKQALVKAKLSRIPKIYLGIENLDEPYVYGTVRIYDQVNRIPEHCKKELPVNDSQQWTVKTLEENFERFSNQLKKNCSILSNGDYTYCVGYLKLHGRIDY